MELNRLLEIAHDREKCDFCEDCGNDALCVKCEAVKGISADELRKYHATVSAALRKAAEYEQLEREGRLVELPCKVGDDVFTMRWSIKNEKCEVFAGEVKNVRYDAIDGSVVVSDGEYYREWGKGAFSSRREADAALGGDQHG